MKNLISMSFFFILGLLPAAGFAAPGDLVSMVQVSTLSQAAASLERGVVMPDAPGSPTNGVISYKLTYETQDLQGQPTTATGMMMVPDTNTGSFPLLSYQHGTVFNKTGAPSYGSNEATGMALLYVSIGYVVAEADYLGLGDSAGFHPYLHADSEAWAAADMLRAVRKATAQLGIQLNAQLFLTGYSQGGQATMALHIHLERDLPNEFKVTASAPLAGPYDLSNTTWKQVLQKPSVDSTAEVAYVLKAMQMIYGLNTLLSDAIQPQFLAATASLLDGVNDMDAVVAGLPATPADYLNAAFIQALSNPAHPFIQALAKNDVYNWKPIAPVHLYQADSDDQVPYANSQLAYATMKALGATIDLTDVGSNLTHTAAAIPALSQSATWFEQIRAQ